MTRLIFRHDNGWASSLEELWLSEDTLASSFNSTNNITLAAGDANGTKLVKNVVIHNLDNVAHGHCRVREELRGISDVQYHPRRG
jgi:hypothetical protein